LKRLRSSISINEIGDSYVADTIEDLNDLEDDIDEEIDLRSGFLEDGRDKAFMFYKNKIYVATGHGQTTDLIEGINDEEKQLILNSRFERNNDLDVAWGHISNRIAVIEKDVSSANLNDVARALKTICDKVYVADDMQGTSVTRIARLRKSL